MYPNEIFLGIDLYSILLCVGIFVCIMTYSYLADKIYLSVKLQKLSLIYAIFAIPLGYGSAVVFQALYNIKDIGRFEISKSTGATFYGGLIGGAAVFLLLYFAAGHFVLCDGYHKRHFFRMANCAMASIAVAHAFGRIGCLMAGCCHGAVTDAWYGIRMHGNMGYARYVPIQLFEAIFLLALFALFIYRTLSGGSYNMPIYMVGYGLWRFFIEYARADERGDTLVSFLSPSQLIACVMILGGVGVFLLERAYENKHREQVNQEIEALKEKRSSRQKGEAEQ